MWEMTHVSGKWLKYLRNNENMWEMTKICGNWLKCLKIGKCIRDFGNG